MSKLILGNWKLNPRTLDEALDLFGKIDFHPRSENEVVVLPPIAFLSSFAGQNVGAQDVGTFKEGAFTGSVSAFQIESLGAKYCLVGHSEVRRTGETAEQRALKLARLLETKVIPVFCVGHGITKEHGLEQGLKIVKEQLAEVSEFVTNTKVVIAFEPEWALSASGNSEDTGSDHMIEMLKITLEAIQLQTNAKVLYGGSVNDSNVLKYLKIDALDGFLIGSASLKPEVFNKIVKA